MMIDETTSRCRTPIRGAAVATLAALLLAVCPWGAAQAQDAEPDLELVPHPELEALDPAARARLEPGIEFFRAQRGQLDGRALGLAYGRVGINYLAHREYAAAAASLHNAGVLDPGNPRWPYLLGFLYQETGRHGEAVEAYRRSLRIKPYAAGFTRLGQSLLAEGRLDEADAAFEVVLERDVNNAGSLMGAGEVSLARGEYDKAVLLFQRGLRNAPEADRFHDRLSAAYRGRGDSPAADREAARAGDRDPPLDDPLIAFVQAHTRGAAHYRDAAHKAEELGNLPVAVKFYEITTSLQPDDTESLLKLGELKGRLGDLDGALGTFARVTLFDPDNAKANYFVGTLLERRGREAEAAGFYERALASSPQLVEPRLLLANSLMRRGEFEAASEHYAQIAHQLPQNIEVQYLLGLAWLAAGQCEWSHKVLGRALAMEPGDAQVMVALARAYSTCGDVTDEQRQQALAAATAMYERSPGGTTAETLAMAAAANGQFEDAIELQAQALFEALKRGDQQEIEWLKQNMSRYEAGQPAVAAWPAAAVVYRPRSLGLTAPTPAG